MKRLAANTFILLASNLSSAVFGFLIAVLVGRGLGAEGLGRYSLVMAWTFALGIFAEFGLNTLITRDVARARDRAQEYLAASLVAKTALSLILAAALVLGSPGMATEADLVAAMQLGSLLIWLNALYGSFTAVFRAYEQMRPVLILNASGLALQLAGTFWLVAIGQGIFPLIALAVAAQAAQTVGGLVLIRSTLGLTVFTRPSPTRMIEMLRAALPFALAGVVGAVEARANFLLLEYFQGSKTLGWYSAAARLTDAAKFLPNAFFGAAFPAFAAMSWDAEKNFGRARGGMVLFSGIVALGITVSAQPLLGSSFGYAFADAQPTLIILAWSLVPALVNGLTILFLYARGEENFANKMLALALLAQLVAALPLIQSYGAAGAAVSALLGDIVLFALLNSHPRVQFSFFRESFALPLLIFLGALLIRLVLIHQTLFDGLYGQDPYAYLDYAALLKEAMASAKIPPPFFWPIGYPGIVALVSFILPAAMAAQAVSVTASALASTITFLLTREILRDRPYSDFAASIAALVLATAGQMLISSLAAMSDATAVFWATLSAFALTRYVRDNRSRWFALAAFALGFAVMTRWVYILLVPVWVLSYALRQQRNTITHLLTAMTFFFLALAPQLWLMTYHAAHGTISSVGDLQTVRWNFSYAWQSDILNGDGHFSYPLPMAAFYAQALAHPSFIFPSLTFCVLFGIWALRRENFFGMMLGGWVSVVFLFLAGIAWENPRFSLAFFPPLAICAGVGWQRFSEAYPRLRKFAGGFAVVSIALTLMWGYREATNFVASQRGDRMIANWTRDELPVDASIITFGITETLKHRTGFRIIEIYNQSPESIAGVLETRRPVYALLDIANIESQWKDLSPEVNWRALQSKANLSVIATHPPYTLFAVLP